ncbi:MAG: hypothetical protein AAFU65_04715 [Pseudomonadota bacterium]
MSWRIAVFAFAMLGPASGAFADEAGEVRNPFARPPGFDTRPGAAPSGMTLRATLVDDARALANIDGRLVAVGDALGRATVVRIELNRVELAVDGKPVILTLREPDAARPKEAPTRDQDD